jgi:hypothetical protein
MKVVGTEGMGPQLVESEVARGGRFVVYQYNFSVVLLSFRRSSDIYFVRAGENAVAKGLRFTLISLFFGWWGIPWGLIWTPMALLNNLRGGSDVTDEVMKALGLGAHHHPPIEYRRAA